MDWLMINKSVRSTGRRTVGMVAAGLAVVLVASACGTGGSGGEPAKATKGGTLKVLMQEGPEHLDPARNYVGTSINMSRLLFPTLTNYQAKAGVAGTTLLNDAATDIGRPNADASEWTFDIRPELKWQDGKQVTCADFKYGVERSFSGELPDGPQYQKQYLVGGKEYKGAYLQPAGLPSVICKGNSITYKLNHGVPDFNFTVAMPLFAAIRKDKDTKAKFDTTLFGYGPYQVEKYDRDQELVLSRNKFWDQTKDKIRKNLPDKFHFEFGVNENLITDRLANDKGDDRNAISIGADTSPEKSTEVLNDADLKKRSVSGLTGYTYYMAINTTKVKDVKCRQAIEYGVNKRTYLTAFGGAPYGDPATSMISPDLKAHKPFDLYGTKTKPEGDVAKAKALLAQSPSCAKTMTLDVRRRGNEPKAAAAIKDALERIGITLKLNEIQDKLYYSSIGKAKAQNELSMASWSSDWPGGSTVIPPLFDGRQIVPEGNQNFAQLNDPAINAGMDAAAKEPNIDKAQKMWGDLDEKVLQTAAVVPMRFQKKLLLHGSGVSGAILDANYNDINLCAVGATPADS